MYSSYCCRVLKVNISPGPCVKYSVCSETVRNWIYQLQSKGVMLHNPHLRFIHGSAWFQSPHSSRARGTSFLPRTTEDARDALKRTHAKTHRCGLKSVSFRWMSGNKNITRAWSESRNVSEEIEWKTRPATLTACLALICSQSLFTSSTPLKIQRVNFVKFMHCSNPLQSPQQ